MEAINSADAFFILSRNIAENFSVFFCSHQSSVLLLSFLELCIVRNREPFDDFHTCRPRFRERNATHSSTRSKRSTMNQVPLTHSLNNSDGLVPSNDWFHSDTWHFACHKDNYYFSQRKSLTEIPAREIVCAFRHSHIFPLSNLRRRTPLVLSCPYRLPRGTSPSFCCRLPQFSANLSLPPLIPRHFHVID